MCWAKAVTFLFNFWLKKIFVQYLSDLWKQSQNFWSIFKLNCLRNRVFFKASVPAYENLTFYFWVSKEFGSSYHPVQKTLKYIRNSIFGEFLKTAKSPLALMERLSVSPSSFSFSLLFKPSLIGSCTPIRIFSEKKILNYFNSTYLARGSSVTGRASANLHLRSSDSGQRFRHWSIHADVADENVGCLRRVRSPN